MRPPLWAALAALSALMLAGCTSPDGAPADVAAVPPAPSPTLPAPVPTPTASATPTPSPPAAPPSTAPPPPPALSVRAGGPYAGAALEWLPVVAVPSDRTASCAWSGDATVEDPASCATRAMAPSAGTWDLAVRASAGTRTAEATATLEAALPTADGRVTGSIYAYNAVAGETLGASNLAALATGHPVYPPGAEVSVSARSVTSDAPIGVDTPAAAFLLDANGTVHAGPLALAGSDEADGTPPGTGYAYGSEPWTLPDVPPGLYLLAVRLEAAGQTLWVQDGTDAPGGHKVIEILDL